MSSKQVNLNQTTIKLKKLTPHAELPEYKTEGSVGMDLVATSYEYNSEFGYHQYGIGIAVIIPEGFEAQLRARSSISNTSLILCNGIGTVDSDFRGQILVRFKEIDDKEIYYEVGDRVAQLVLSPIAKANIEEVTELDDTARGSGGFGSTNK